MTAKGVGALLNSGESLPRLQPRLAQLDEDALTVGDVGGEPVSMWRQRLAPQQVSALPIFQRAFEFNAAKAREDLGCTQPLDQGDGTHTVTKHAPVFADVRISGRKFRVV